jgi:hypothetical protein
MRPEHNDGARRTIAALSKQARFGMVNRYLPAQAWAEFFADRCGHVTADFAPAVRAQKLIPLLRLLF